jgi:endonuclease-3
MHAAAAKRRIGRILTALAQTMPTPRVELSYANPWQLLVATILSAQCTDQRVNQVTPGLFTRYSGMGDFAEARQAELETLIRPTGFFKNKARNLVACAKTLTERFGGKIPATMEELVTLPGVGRKTANVVLGAWFKQPAVVVDTHVKRVAKRLGLSSSDDPDRIEADVQSLIPKPSWTIGSQRLLLHGRYVCLARKPRCGQCVIYQECRWEGKRAR